MTREQLTAILTATRTDALHLDDTSYLDWSSRDDNGTIGLEVGDATGNALVITLTRTDMEALVHRLAATLLA